MTDTNYSFTRKATSWGVHAFTMSGVIWACLASLALVNGTDRAFWGWLAIALIVDGVDGIFARKAEVSKVIPWFDGATLDNIVDYLNWTFLPAIFMYLHIDFWGLKPLALIMLFVVCTSSMFCYCNRGMKSSDYYFVGFPAAWNIVILYMYLLQAPAWVNVFFVLLFAVLTLAPITFVHPFRVKWFRIPNLVATAVWFACSIYLTIVFPTSHIIVDVLWWGSGMWLLLVSALRTFMGKREDDVQKSCCNE